MFKVAIITSSDSGYKGDREDKSGPVIRKIVEENGYEVVHTILLPDEKDILSAEINEKLLTYLKVYDIIYI